MDKPLPENVACGVCHGESGGNFIGVASVPGVPMSIAWCSECLKRDCAPEEVFSHDFIYVARGDVTVLNEWARSRETWVDGRYVTFDEYVRRISLEEVAAELTKWDNLDIPPIEA